MKSNFYTVMKKHFTIFERLHCDSTSQTIFQDRYTLTMREIKIMSRVCMVAMRMRDDCPMHRFPRINVKIPRFTIDSFWCELKKLWHEREGKNRLKRSCNLQSEM